MSPGAGRSARAGDAPDPVPREGGPLARRVLGLAVPALGALIAEPLFLLADAAIVGRLGTPQLAGAGVGATVVQTLVGLMVFLAYATTPAVARLVGAGRTAEALARGRDGGGRGLLLGVVLGAAGWAAAPALTAALGATGEVQAHAVAYLRWSMPGLPPLLAVLAATGVLRGLQDTVTPLVVAGAGFAANIGLNLALVHGAGMGVAGSALGTALTQWGMLAAYLVVLAPRLRAAAVAWAPTGAGMRATAQVGSWLLLRTASLRAAILITVAAAAGAGAVVLAAHQLVFTLFSTLAFALDALAIAAQSLIGAELGASRPAVARRLTRTLSGWSTGFGALAGLALAAVAVPLPALFTADPAVQAAATAGLLVLACAQPVAGLVFVLDGVLIGAGDARYLAVAGVVNLAVYAPALWLAARAAEGAGDPGRVALLWVGFAGVYLGMRALTLGLRARTGAWMRLGAG